MQPVPADRRTSPDEVFAVIEELKANAEREGVQDWFARVTGYPMNGSAWEKRFERARQRGWIDQLHADEFLGMVRKAAEEALEGSPEPRRTQEWASVPRLPSEPLRRALDAHRAEVMAGRRRHGSGQPRIRPAIEIVEGDEVTIYEADKQCVRRLGVHPAMVYGDDWWTAVA